MKNHSNECDVVRTGECTCDQRAIITNLEKQTQHLQDRIDAIIHSTRKPGLLGRLLCKAGFHSYQHAGFVAWNRYRLSCDRGCGATWSARF